MVTFMDRQLFLAGRPLETSHPGHSLVPEPSTPSLPCNTIWHQTPSSCSRSTAACCRSAAMCVLCPAVSLSRARRPIPFWPAVQAAPLPATRPTLPSRDDDPPWPCYVVRSCTQFFGASISGFIIAMITLGIMFPVFFYSCCEWPTRPMSFFAFLYSVPQLRPTAPPRPSLTRPPPRGDGCKTQTCARPRRKSQRREATDPYSRLAVRCPHAAVAAVALPSQS